MAIIIRNAIIATMNPGRDVLNGDIRIEGSRITEIGQVQPVEGDQLIDAGGRIVAPGLIQSHTHLCQTLFRGLADDLELLDWLKLRIWPLEAAHDTESLYISALLGCAELIRGGTTAIIDMATVHHTTEVFRAASESGIRYLGGKCLMDDCEQKNLVEDREQALAESLDLMDRWHNSCQGRIRYAFCPRFAVSCSEPLLREVAVLAAKYGVAVHTHASENSNEIALVRRRHGMENIEFLENLGLCSESLIVAHCIHVNESEMRILASNRVNVAHCPSSNQKLASGIAMIPEMLARGINVGLGADGAPCNNRLCAFTEMRQAALIQKPRLGPSAMKAEEVLAMCTLGGARAMGMADQLGSLEVGKIADIIMVDNRQLHNQPMELSTVYSQMVYQLNALDVDMTMVDGQILYIDGHLKGLDRQSLISACQRSVKRIYHRAGLD